MVLKQLGKVKGAEIQSTLTGGIWLSAPIGGVISDVLAQQGINTTWEDWSYSDCTARNYGVVLDLETGGTQVFYHSDDACSSFMTPLLSETRHKFKYGLPLTEENKRADIFLTRFKMPAISQAGKKFYFLQQNPLTYRAPTKQEISQQSIPIYHLHHH